ncbi:MAG: 2,5-dioxovalerate dehydrogenase [Cyclobacteriaceae bacterium]|nr:MAG: 2,5-dioxovalerate dehydrogenase [Cyclobacteriaceae bacterium]
MELLGKQYIGNKSTAEGKEVFYGINPRTGEALGTAFHEATEDEINQAIELAETAFKAYTRISVEKRAEFLEAIAEEIGALGHALLQRAESETSLPFPRLQGECGRTMNQLKLFAQVVREGSWVDARIDTALPDRQPIPRSDIRHMQVPLGPVAVFGASNFPLAFSVAGGDTASALASGCPVVVKGHPAHPGTSEMVAKAILAAAEKTGMPNGVFSLVQGQSHQVGSWLVKHPLIQAVGFTGSFKGGKALFDIANRRGVPIPVFAEMGSTNPVFILPEALKSQGAAIAGGLAGSITLGVGQFCTNPGLAFVPEGSDQMAFGSMLAEKIEELSMGPMLTEGIRTAFQQGTNELAQDPAVERIALGTNTQEKFSVDPQVFAVGFEEFSQRPEWSQEIFGPTSLLVKTRGEQDLLQAASELEGHLTATVHGTTADFEEHQDLIRVLERKVGRVVINGYPTGVEVCHAMVHGGPYPATTAPHSTSVGSNAIKRFVRPLCFQDYPQSLLPVQLKDENELGIMRMVNGEFTREALVNNQQQLANNS